MAKRQKITETNIPVGLAGVFAQAAPFDPQRIYLGLFPSSDASQIVLTTQQNKPGLNCLTIGSGTGGGPGLELYMERSGQLVWQQWNFALGNAGSGGSINVIAVTEYEGDSDEDFKLFDEQPPAVSVAVPGTAAEDRAAYIGRMLKEAWRAYELIQS